MATENLDINVNVDTEGATGPIKSFREQLKEATKDVITMSEKFGATSDEAVNAAKKVAELRDRLGDAKSLTDAFNPDAKFKALTSSLSGVAGGFGAVQGAMALFGTESDNVQKTLLKVQSAMALSQGLQSIGESIDSFKILASVIRTQVVAAFATLRSAIISTGVLALVAGVGYLISKLIEWADSTDDATAAQERLNKSLSTQEEYLNLNVKALERANKYRISKLKEQGATEAEITKVNRENQKKILEAYEEDYRVKYAKYQKDLTRISKIEDEEKKKNAEKASDDLRKQLISDDERMKDLRVQMRTDKMSAIKAENDQEKAERIAHEEWLIKLEIEYNEKRQAKYKKLGRDMIGRDGMTNDEREKAKKEEADRQKAIDDKAQIVMDNMANNLGKSLAIKADALGKEYKQEEDANLAKIKLGDIELEAKRAQFQTMTQFIGNLGSAFEQGTAASKTAAIAEIGINTALGYIQGLDIAQKGAKGTGPLAPFTMPIFYASQVLAVITAIGKAKQALSQVKGGGSVSMPSMTSSAPMTPQLPIAVTTNISQQSINDIGNNAVRAYVVESDVTSSQERITAIRQRARFS
jgi:hypothetical protein